MRRKSVLVFGLLILLSAIAVAQSRRTVWGGVYTAAQAERGKAQYEKTCMRCHAANLDGVQDANLLGDFSPRVAIRGTDFMERWREDTVHSLFNLVSGGMPPRTDPNFVNPNISREGYVDIVAYVLQQNGFPAGNQELNLDELRSVRIQEKDGAKPLSSFSRVQVVGCLTQYMPGQWQLSNSGEPIRIRELKDPTDEDLKAAESEPLGNTDFDLQNIGYLGRQFNPVDYEGSKMVARGVLIRQPPLIRIDVRALVRVASTCP